MTDRFTLDVLQLDLNTGFTAWDLNVEGQAPWPQRDRKHRFTRPDGPEAHDHPFGIEVYIPRDGGGYIEEIYSIEPDGTWVSTCVTREPGAAFYIPARRVHRIARLLAPVVYTNAITGPFEQEWSVWRFTGPQAERRLNGTANFIPVSDLAR